MVLSTQVLRWIIENLFDLAFANSMFIDVRQSRSLIYVVADRHSRILARVTIHVHAGFNEPTPIFTNLCGDFSLLDQDPPTPA